jgi:hypothetical protein
MVTQQSEVQGYEAKLRTVVMTELERRVGTRLSDGMSERQLGEFEALIDRDRGQLSDWLREYSPDFENDPQFKKIETAMPDLDPLALAAEYAASKWLELNRPDYQQISRLAMHEIAEELSKWANSLANDLREMAGNMLEENQQAV